MSGTDIAARATLDDNAASAASGAGAATTSDAAPTLPSTVARIVTDPAATAVTTPLADTVARDASAELHDTVRPPRTLPAVSRAVAVACVV